MTATPRAAARVQILLTALLFSTGGAAIKGCSFSAWQVAGLRSALAAAAVLLMLREARRRPDRLAMWVAVPYAITLLLFVTSTKLTTAANAIFLQSTAPIYTLLLGPWLLRERARPRDAMVGAALAVGLALFLAGADRPTASAPDPARGNLLAAACGLTWALTILGLRGLGRRGDGSAASAVVIGNLLAAAVALPLAPFPAAGGARDWLVVGYLGVAQIGVAYAMLTRALRHVPAFEASLLLQLELVMNPVWAFLFQGEVPAGPSLAGCAIILAATTAKSALDARQGAAPRPAGRGADPGAGGVG